MFSKSPIEKAKARAAKAYRRYFDIAESRQYSCGMSLAAMITPELAKEARNFNAAMRDLKGLDPTCPEYSPLPE
jgi:hypothetical protein